MSRRCRASLFEEFVGADGSGSDFSSGCDCGRIGGGPGIPCVDFIVQAAAPLDSIIARTGLGPGGDEVPIGSTEGFYAVFSDGIKAEFPVYYAPDDAHTMTIETTDPPGSDIYHFFVAGSAGSAGNDIRYATGFSCDGVRRPYFTKLKPGDLIVATAAAKASTTSGTPRLRTFIDWNESDGTSIAQEQWSWDLTTSYVNYVAAIFVPAGDTYMAQVRWDQHFVTNTAAWYWGQPSIVLFNTATGILLCAFNSLTTVDNSTTETSFLS